LILLIYSSGLLCVHGLGMLPACFKETDTNI